MCRVNYYCHWWLNLLYEYWILNFLYVFYCSIKLFMWFQQVYNKKICIVFRYTYISKRHWIKIINKYFYTLNYSKMYTKLRKVLVLESCGGDKVLYAHIYYPWYLSILWLLIMSMIINNLRLISYNLHFTFIVHFKI